MQKAYGDQVRLDLDDLGACLDSGDVRDEIAADMRKTSELGVGGTPTFFIDGRLLNGSPAAEGLSQAIEAELLRTTADRRRTAIRATGRSVRVTLERGRRHIGGRGHRPHVMRTTSWLLFLSLVALLSVGFLAAPVVAAAPSSRRVERAARFRPSAKAAAVTATKHCGEGKLCPAHAVGTVYGFSKTFADVHLQSSVMLALGSDADYEGFCSGTLLGPNTIVTASHCFDESRGKGAKDAEVRVVWNYRKQKSGSWAWPRYVGRVMKVTKRFDKADIDVAVATVRWTCGEVPPVAAPPGAKVSVGQKVISFQHPLGRETHVASGRIEGIDEHRADDFDEDGPEVYAWSKMRAVSNGSGGGVFGPTGGLVGVVVHQYANESGFVQLSSIRNQVPRLNLWAHGDKLLGDVATGAAACIPK